MERDRDPNAAADLRRLHEMYPEEEILRMREESAQHMGGAATAGVVEIES